MATNVWHECLRYAVYYAPRGRNRLLALGESIGQRYLAPGDRLVGIMGEAGTGKSSVISGMFPGLELTNDDEGVNVRPLPLIQMHRDGRFRAHTFHVDALFEMAFAQAYEIADAIRNALRHDRRVVVEHFDRIYPLLDMNAHLLVGIGEEIYVARPDLFGPFPADIVRAIEGTAVYRRMAHSAEDITSLVLEKELGHPTPQYHSDVPRGFVIEMKEKPEDLDLGDLEAKVARVIADDVAITHEDENHIRIGESIYPCTGPRIHVSRSSEIENFRLAKELSYDTITDSYCVVGFVGSPEPLPALSRRPPDPARPSSVGDNAGDPPAGADGPTRPE
ncbi:MAG: alanine-tRNA synthetase second additional domain-containing protein [Planctomycetota bacterium]|jgi:hypothetical protein